MLDEAEGSCNVLAPGVVGVHLLVLSLKVADGIAGDGLVDRAMGCVAGQHGHVTWVLTLLVMMKMKMTMVTMMMMTMILIMMARTTA